MRMLQAPAGSPRCVAPPRTHRLPTVDAAASCSYNVHASCLSRSTRHSSNERSSWKLHHAATQCSRLHAVEMGSGGGGREAPPTIARDEHPSPGASPFCAAKGDHADLFPTLTLELPPATHTRVTSSEYLRSSVKTSDCPPPKLPEFAVIGRSNVGKSSLINMITNTKRLAHVSKEPGACMCIYVHALIVTAHSDSA